MSKTNFPSSDLQIRPASFNDIPYIQEIAFKTWPAAYDAILISDQLKYMLNKFYSTASLTEQLQNHHHFFLALKNFSPIGFASFSHIEADIYKLQKLYVLPAIQKSGAGKQLLITVETVVQSMGGNFLQLNVNRNNNAKTFYEKNGFAIIKEEDINIGEGYWMNDYIMQKDFISGTGKA